MLETPPEAAARSHFPRLMSPGEIAGVRIRNRIVFQPHSTAMSRDGFPSEDQVAYHEERAAGGAGLSIFETQATHPTGKMSRLFPHAWDPDIVPHYRRVTEAVHAHGARMFGQLTHGGPNSLEKPPGTTWAPTQMVEPSASYTTQAMEPSDIAEAVLGFAAGARNTRDGGFDGVEIKVAHDGLLRAFASPYLNRRTDAYGGSLENRMRLSVEVLEAARRAVGPGYPIGVRICLHEFTPWGYELEYGLRIAEHLEETGLVDYFNVTAGSFASYWKQIAPAAVPQGFARPLIAGLKQQSDLPVIGFGRLGNPGLAEEVLAGAEADFIGMARPLIADPELPNKLLAGDPAAVRACIACNDACIYQVGQEKPIRCVQNPAAGRERELSERRLRPATTQRRVVVVGGGPAGMKVAETAARRGHRVTLLERGAELGGQVLLAGRQPYHEEVLGTVHYLAEQLRRLRVDVQLGVEVDVAALEDREADVIVVATGSQPNLPGDQDGDPDAAAAARARGLQVLPELAGLDAPGVLSADAVMRADVPPRGTVAVIDDHGHWEAAGTAEYLAEAGCDVVALTSRALVGWDLDGSSRILFAARAAERGIRMLTGVHVREIVPGRLRLQGVDGGPEHWLDADHVVPVLGRRSRVDVYHAIAERHAGEATTGVVRVGDCVAPRLIQHALADGYALGRRID